MIQMGESEKRKKRGFEKKSTIETGTVVAITQRYSFSGFFFLKKDIYKYGTDT